VREADQNLGVPAEGLGPGGAAEEEQGPVERLRPPDSVERAASVSSMRRMNVPASRP
jgi:hypothetical protein